MWYFKLDGNFDVGLLIDALIDPAKSALIDFADDLEVFADLFWSLLALVELHI